MNCLNFIIKKKLQIRLQTGTVKITGFVSLLWVHNFKNAIITKKKKKAFASFPSKTLCLSCLIAKNVNDSWVLFGRLRAMGETHVCKKKIFQIKTNF